MANVLFTRLQFQLPHKPDNSLLLTWVHVEAETPNVTLSWESSLTTFCMYNYGRISERCRERDDVAVSCYDHQTNSTCPKGLHSNACVHIKKEAPMDDTLICAECGDDFDSTALYQIHLASHEDDKKRYASMVLSVQIEDKPDSSVGLFEGEEKFHVQLSDPERNLNLQSCDETEKLDTYIPYTKERTYGNREVMSRTGVSDSVAGYRLHLEAHKDITEASKQNSGAPSRVLGLSISTEASVNNGKPSSEKTPGQRKTHMCPQCGKLFGRSSHLKRHLDSHMGVKEHVCIVCRKAYSDSSSLRRHLRTHTGEKPFQCMECGRGFREKGDLRSHIRTHGEKPFSCAECGKKVARKRSLMLHMQRLHALSADLVVVSNQGEARMKRKEKEQADTDSLCGVNGQYQCLICLHFFDTSHRLSTHMLQHQAKELVIKEEKCNDSATGCASAHVTTGEKCIDNGTPTNISTDKKSLGDYSDFLQVDVKQEPVDDAIPGQTPGSGSGAKPKRKYRKRGDTSVVMCSECSKTFKYPSELRKHMREHTGDKPYPCPHCDKRFQVPSSLVRHMRIHTGEKPYKCPHCDKAFKRNHHLTSHLLSHNRDPEEEVAVPCKVCGKDVPRKRMKRHMRTHSKVRPHVCPVCGKTYKNSQSLENHRQKCKPYICPVCEEQFHELYAFGEHLRNHANYEELPSLDVDETVEAGINENYLSAKEYEEWVRREGLSKVISDENNMNELAHKPSPGEGSKSEILVDKDPVRLPEPSTTDEPQVPFSCPECDEVSSNINDFGDHIRDHATEKWLRCPICDKAFKFPRLLQRHQLCHSSERGFPCPYCDKAFKREYVLTKHLKTHTEEAKHTCHICSKAYHGSSSLDYHIKTHYREKGMKVFSCRYCKDVFAKKHKLTEHTRRVHFGRCKFTCLTCEKTFSNQSALRRHALIHSGERPHACPHCDRAFRDKGDLKKHIMTHTGEKPHLCTVCGAGFIRRAALNRHIYIHSNQKRYKCPQCNRQCSSTHRLRVHMRSHTGEKPFLCTQCGKRFADDHILAVHYRSHSGLKPYQCKLCGNSFGYSGSLKLHMARHKGRLPFTCMHCPRSYPQKKLLLLHVRKVHLDENPYACKTCGRAFKCKTSLLNHEASRCGKFPIKYFCPECDKHFNSKARVFRHMRNIHEIKDHKDVFIASKQCDGINPV